MRATEYLIEIMIDGKTLATGSIAFGSSDANILIAARRSFDLWYPRYTDQTSGNYCPWMPKNVNFDDCLVQVTGRTYQHNCGYTHSKVTRTIQLESMYV